VWLDIYTPKLRFFPGLFKSFEPFNFKKMAHFRHHLAGEGLAAFYENWAQFRLFSAVYAIWRGAIAGGLI
jgi:hypothetical protein